MEQTLQLPTGSRVPRHVRRYQKQGPLSQDPSAAGTSVRRRACSFGIRSIASPMKRRRSVLVCQQLELRLVVRELKAAQSADLCVLRGLVRHAAKLASEIVDAKGMLVRA